MLFSLHILSLNNLFHLSFSLINQLVSHTPPDKPQITMSPGCFSKNITEGDTLSLNCSAKGNPAPSYDWLHPQSAPAPNTTEERSVVTITNMAKSHSGEYTCIARNPLGNSTCTVNVEVTGEMDG